MPRPAPPHLLLAAYCGGLCLALAVRPAALVLAAAAALSAGWLAVALARREAFGRFGRGGVAVALAGLFVIVGVAVGEGRLAQGERSVLASRVGQELSLEAVLVSLPTVKNDRVTLPLSVRRAGGVALREPATLTLKLETGQTLDAGSDSPLVEGALLAIDGVRVEPLPPPRPGAFDYGRYLRRRGQHVLLEGSFADLRLVGRRGGLQGLVDRLRGASRQHLRAGVHPPVSDVLQGMVLGDDQAVDQQSIDDFRRSGLLHIMAVSGENVVLLCAMWSFAFSLLALPRLLRTALLVPIVITYVVLTGASPSIVRAGVAGVFALLAVLASRQSDGWLLWLVPAAWLLTLNPDTLYDVSFQLSFAAVLGLLLLSRRLASALHFLPGPLPEQAGITAAASLSTAPVSMLTFGSMSLVAVPANIVGGFVLGPIMFCGMLSLLLGFVAAPLSAPLNMLAGLFIGFLLTVARLFGSLPWATWEWRGLSLPLVLAALGAAGLVAVLALGRRSGAGALAYWRDPRRRVALLASVCVAVALALLLTPRPPQAPTRPTLTFLSVGEGAAALLQVPGGPTVLIDAGPAPLGAALRAHAVHRIDLLVLSHGHADHVAGLSDVLGSVPVRAALLPRPSQPLPELDRLAGELSAAGAAVTRVETPVLCGGPGWSLQALPTKPPQGESGNQSQNDTALVALVGLGNEHMLLPGDAEGEVLNELSLPPCDVVELPHHGSRGGLSAEQIGALRPRLAVVSVGPNTYGHPTPEMMSLLAAARVPCLRTDHSGDVAVWAEGAGLGVRAAHGG